MIVDKEDFGELKYPKKFKYKVYRSHSKHCYIGHALIAAESAIEANKFIQAFADSDPKNVADSRGLNNVSEDNHTDQYSNISGIIENEIMYCG